MDPDEPLGQFLARLFEMSSGDPSAQISMYEIGAELGLEKELATRTAEELISEVLALVAERDAKRIKIQ